MKKAKKEIDKNDSADEMDSDDLDGDLDLSDDESGTQNREQIREAKRSSAVGEQQQPEDRETFKVEFDTNIFQVKLDCLERHEQLVTGDAEFCSKCKGVFN